MLRRGIGLRACVRVCVKRDVDESLINMKENAKANNHYSIIQTFFLYKLLITS